MSNVDFYINTIAEKDKIILNQRHILEQLDTRLQNIHDNANQTLISTVTLVKQINQLELQNRNYKHKMESYLYTSIVLNLLLGALLCIKYFLN
jgi:small-conductance mechanosensitive channel